MKYLITFSNISWQKGSWAQVDSLVSGIKKIDSNASIYLLSHQYEVDIKNTNHTNLEVIGLKNMSKYPARFRSVYIYLLRLFFIFMHKIGMNKILKNNSIYSAYYKTDLILDLAGDSFRDPPGGHSIAHIAHFKLCQLMSKRVWIISQTIGPFKEKNMNKVHDTLKYIYGIYIRDEFSKKYCKNSNVINKTHLIPDIAFTLEPKNGNTISKSLNFINDQKKKERPIIAISTSILLYELFKDKYIHVINTIIKYLTEINASIIFVPHEYKTGLKGTDDFNFTEFYVNANPPKCHFIIQEPDPTPNEIKYLMSKCDLAIAGRMHAGIAALSSNVPTIFISWSEKYVNLIKSIQLPEKWVFDMRNNNDINTLLNTIPDALFNAEYKEVLIKYNKEAEVQINKVIKIIVNNT